MPVYIEMPKLSDTMTEGTLLKWLKSEGDKVDMREAIAEVETDKATMEMESFDEGVIHKIYVQEGDKSPVGGALALLLAEGEEPPADADTPPAPKAVEAAPAEDASQAQSTGGGATVTSASKSTASATSNFSGKASPLARKIAAEQSVDLNTIVGTGPGGRITKKDVLRGPSPALQAAGAGAAVGAGVAAAAVSPAILPEVGADDTRIELSGMRSVIAQRLLASKTQIPHFYLTIEVDAEPLMAMRKQVNADAEAGKEGANKYTVNDFILKSVVDAMVAVPEANASWNSDSIIQFADVNLAVAVAIEGGLVTPVIRAAQKKSLLEVSQEMKELAGKARDKKLTPDEMQGGTVSVSNLGAYGIDSFDAIINPPQALILSIGNIVKKPVIDKAGEIVPGLRMNIGMSCDHRVIDGAVGANYLAEVRKSLENPALMLV